MSESIDLQSLADDETEALGLEGDGPEGMDDGPQSGVTRLYDMLMAPSPPPKDAGELFGDDISWDMYVASAVEGMSGSGGMPAFVMLLIGLFMMVEEGVEDESGQESGDLAPEDIEGL